MLGCVKCLIGNKVKLSAKLIRVFTTTISILLQAQCSDTICGLLQLHWEFSPS